MAIENSIKHGETLLDNDKPDQAIEEFNNALKESPSSFKALIGRSKAHQRLKQYDESLNDLLLALKISKEKSNRENIGLSYLRLAIVYFNKKEFGKSLKSINLAKEFGSSDPSFGIWLSKITKKTAKENIAEEEIEKLLPLKPVTVTAAPTTAKAPIQLEPKTPKMSYYQSENTVTVDFFYKNVSNPNIEFKPTSLSVEFKTLTGSDVIYEYKLFAPVIPEECSFKIMSTKVEVTLRKKQPIKWTGLEGSGEDVVNLERPKGSTTSASPLLYPTSSKSKTNWANFQVDDDDDEDDSNADENAFFQKLYAGADDDTKRAMMKSFVESNGTALSTNWKETKEKKWDINPPDGVEPKKW